ncbi:MAG: hypothetical protein K5637_01780 [Lachnospiraceae bacterium]|nr:hypothetical protein [Lachnospiraceae bacterium]
MYTVYHIIDNRGDVWASDIASFREAESMLDDILSEHPEAEALEPEIIDEIIGGGEDV